MTSDPHDLQRFVDAQAPVIDRVLDELRRGRKRSHWMWFVFPQIAGLGFSATSRRYAIRSLAEARAYLAHPLLGPRLLECTRLVVAVEHRTLLEIFGDPDDAKFRSSMTLFAKAASDDAPFVEAVAKYCGGCFDPRTVERLAA